MIKAVSHRPLPLLEAATKESGVEAIMIQKSVMDRTGESLATTGAGLQEEVKRQYCHECGHIGIADTKGWIKGDSIARADQILRETMAMNGWDTMNATARSEAIKRAFYLFWREGFGLKGELDTRPFGEGCCGFARAMGEWLPGFPAEDSVINRSKESS